VVTCTGAPHERGEQHGEALRIEIADGLGRWAESIASAHGVDPDAYIAAFVRGTDFLPAIRRWTPGLAAEVEGIARGANQPWEWIYAFNLLDEAWTWARENAALPPGCTAVGYAPEDGTPLLAQTMDIDSFHDGAQAVLRIASDAEPDLLLFTYAGMIGLTGCNAAGVAVVVNNLDVLPTSRNGLPVAFVIRGILDRPTLEDAVDFVGQVPHATGQHYGISSPAGLASIEARATGVANSPPDSCLLHTNHPLYTNETVGDPERSYRASRTRERLAYLEREADRANDVAGIQQLLADRTTPISLGAERRSMTFGAVVYESSVPPTMWLAPGPPHLKAFRHIPWPVDKEPTLFTKTETVPAAVSPF
jgi:isopenicillin-N N-acyltransferase like protein